MLEYVLEVNELTAAPDDYRAQVVNVTSHRPSELVAVSVRAALTYGLDSLSPMG
jgi:hypothetical protein